MICLLTDIADLKSGRVAQLTLDCEVVLLRNSGTNVGEGVNTCSGKADGQLRNGRRNRATRCREARETLIERGRWKRLGSTGVCDVRLNCEGRVLEEKVARSCTLAEVRDAVGSSNHHCLISVG